MPSTSSPAAVQALLDQFSQAARKEFRERMVRAENQTARYLNSERSRDLLVTMMTMTDDERCQIFGDMLHDHRGPASIDGMEAILSFIDNYIMDDGSCIVVPYVPGQEFQDTFRATAEEFTAADPDANAEAMVNDWLARQAMWRMVVPGEYDADRPASVSASEIIEAIHLNRRLTAEDLAEKQRWLDDDRFLGAEGECVERRHAPAAGSRPRRRSDPDEGPVPGP